MEKRENCPAWEFQCGEADRKFVRDEKRIAGSVIVCQGENTQHVAESREADGTGQERWTGKPCGWSPDVVNHPEKRKVRGW